MPVTSFNLSAEAVQLIEALKSGLGLDNKSMVVELAIREMVQNRQAKEAEKHMQDELKRIIRVTLLQEINRAVEDLMKQESSQAFENKQKMEVEFSERMVSIEAALSWVNDLQPLNPEAAQAIRQALANQEQQVYQTARARIEESAQKFSHLPQKSLPAIADAQRLTAEIIQKEFEPEIMRLNASRHYLHQIEVASGLAG